MYQGKKIIAIIPARSGSKGLRDKNIKPLNGKPLIAYTIEAACESRMFDRVLVSTDSEGYADVARAYGAEVPFLRSMENATDQAGTWDVVREVLSRLDKKYDVVVVLQPTSPLRGAHDICSAVNFFFERDADTVASVCEMAHPLFWCNTLPDDLSMENFVSQDVRGFPRQQLPKSYTLNGAIYVCRTSVLDRLDFYSARSYAYVMTQASSIDIDSLLDFKYADLVLKMREEKGLFYDD